MASLRCAPSRSSSVPSSSTFRQLVGRPMLTPSSIPSGSTANSDGGSAYNSAALSSATVRASASSRKSPCPSHSPKLSRLRFLGVVRRFFFLWYAS